MVHPQVFCLCKQHSLTKCCGMALHLRRHHLITQKPT